MVKCCRRSGFHPWVGKIPWRRKWQPTPVLLPGKSHGWRSLVGYSSWGCKESDMNVMHAHSSASDMTLMIISVPTSQMSEVLTWRCPLLSSHKSQFFFVAITFFHILLSITAILLRWNPSVPFSHPPCPTTWWMELGGTRPFIWARLKPAD